MRIGSFAKRSKADKRSEFGYFISGAARTLKERIVVALRSRGGCGEFAEYKKAFGRKYHIKASELTPKGERGLVSVVLPVYNGDKYLIGAIESVLSQTYKNIELIIVDDGSTDHSGEIADAYARLNPHVKAARQSNLRLPAALNRGFEIAGGEFFTWISADNIMRREFIAETVEELNRDKEAAMVYSNMRLIDHRGDILRGFGWYEYPPGSGNVILPASTLNLNTKANNTIGAAFMYRASAADIIGGYDGDMFGFEDYDYWMRMNEVFKIKHSDFKKPLYYYRMHDGSLTAKDTELRITERREGLMEFDKERRAAILKQPLEYTGETGNLYLDTLKTAFREADKLKRRYIRPL